MSDDNREDEDDSPPSVRNPGDRDYNQKQRLEQYWQARKRLADVNEELSINIGETIGQHRAEKLFHQQLDHYLKLTNALYLDVYADLGKPLWKEYELGTQAVPPPSALAEQNGQFNSVLIEPAAPEERPFVGLQSLLNTNPVSEITFEAIVIERHRGQHRKTATEQVTVPWGVLNTAWMVTESFMDRIGMGVDTGGEEDRDAPTF